MTGKEHALVFIKVNKAMDKTTVDREAPASAATAAEAGSTRGGSGLLLSLKLGSAAAGTAVFGAVFAMVSESTLLQINKYDPKYDLRGSCHL
jgi:hypothetical protein